MPIGPGKCDHLATRARLDAKADGVVLIVFGGKLHGGFSVQGPVTMHAQLPAMLRVIADQIESDVFTQTAQGKRQ